MFGLPRGFTRGLFAGGLSALLWRVMADRSSRIALGGRAIEGAERIPFLGARVSRALADQWMTAVYRGVAEDVTSMATTGELLDLGSGAGQLAIEIAQRARNLQIATMYPAPDWVQVAESRIHNSGLGRQAKVVLGSAVDIPFPDGAFDFVVALEGFRRCGAPEAVLAETYRVLKPGGWAWIYDFRRESPETEWETARRNLPPVMRPLFEARVLASRNAAYDGDQIDLYAAGSPFHRATIDILPAEVGGTKIQALTRATFRK